MRMMARELTPIDISAMPDLLRIAEEVRDTNQPRLLRRAGEDVAMVTPVKRRSTRARGKPTSADDPLWNIVGIADGPDDGVTDVSENKHRYLAEAYAPKPE
jgi:hypothetical protein